MYNQLFEQLEQKDDVSFFKIYEQIVAHNFSKEVLAFMDNVEDYIQFFEKLSQISSQNLMSQPVPFLLILNRIKQIPSTRTSRYL